MVLGLAGTMTRDITISTDSAEFLQMKRWTARYVSVSDQAEQRRMALDITDKSRRLTGNYGQRGTTSS